MLQKRIFGSAIFVIFLSSLFISPIYSATQNVGDSKNMFQDVRFNLIKDIDILMPPSVSINEQLHSSGNISIFSYGDITISSEILASGTGSAIKIESLGIVNILPSARLISGNGANGRGVIVSEATSSQSVCISGENGGNGGDIIINAPEIVIDGEIILGNGGNGGNAIFESLNPTSFDVRAIGGNGGNSGRLIINGKISTCIKTILCGKGGDGGNAVVILDRSASGGKDGNESYDVGENGTDDSTGPGGNAEDGNATAGNALSATNSRENGGNGGNATAIGGTGGKGATQGGNGGSAYSIAGNGGNGCNNESGNGSNGGDGGCALSKGGFGGNCTFNGPGGNGGNASAFGGKGGNADGIHFAYSIIGGTGGRCGKAKAYGGTGGGGGEIIGGAGGNGGWAFALGGNGGNGGNATTPYCGDGGGGYGNGLVDVDAVGGGGGQSVWNIPLVGGANGGNGGNAGGIGGRGGNGGFRINYSIKLKLKELKDNMTSASPGNDVKMDLSVVSAGGSTIRFTAKCPDGWSASFKNNDIECGGDEIHNELSLKIPEIVKLGNYKLRVYAERFDYGNVTCFSFLDIDIIVEKAEISINNKGKFIPGFEMSVLATSGMIAFLAVRTKSKLKK
jgi:hypothetical protein